MAVQVPAILTASQLERIDWEYRTPVLGALSHRFAIRTDDLDLGCYLAQLLGALALPEQPAAWYSLLHRSGTTRDEYTLYFGPECLNRSANAHEAVSWLLHHVNRQAIESCTGQLVVHAAAAESDGRALLLPAPPGSGKSTLVAGLVRAGLRYLTDDAAALDVSSLEVRPYPKPISIKPGSQPSLRDVEPLGPDGAHSAGADWWVSASSIRGNSVAAAAQPALVIAPSYVAGATTSLSAMRAAETVMVLAENSFNLLSHGEAGLVVLARVARRCEGYRLVVGDLGVACRLVLELLERSPSAQPAPGPVRA